MMNEGCSIISSGVKKEKKKRKKRKRSSDTDCKSNSNSIATNSTNNTTSAPHKVVGKKTTEKNKSAVSSIGKYPYPTDYNDHFETPARAYDDIYPLLEYVLTNKQKCKHNRKCSNEATIYDPYYCAGRAGTLLDDLFQRHQSKRISSTSIRIQHEKRDFYKDIKQKTVPNHDILVTNPPYSEDHKEKCLEFAVNQLKEHGRPFFLLMPNYIAMKEYFRTIVLFGEGKKKMIQTFYITPSKQNPYEYDHPEGTGHKVSPFASVWFIGLSYTDNEVIKSTNQVVMDAFTKFHTSGSKSGTPQIVSSLQNLLRIGAVSAEKRKNPRQRKKIKKAMQRAAAASGSSGVNLGVNISSNQQAKSQKRKPDGDRQKDKRTKSKKRKIR